MHSWRVILLKFCAPEQCSGYDFDEPWDGPHNRRLHDRAPEFLQCPSRRPSGNTSYVLVTGPGTLFAKGRDATMSEITDDPAHTLLLAEVSSTDINWLEPRDLDTATMSFRIDDETRPAISSSHPEGPAVGFANYRVHRLSPDGADPERIKALTTIAGGEPVDLSPLIDATKRD